MQMQTEIPDTKQYLLWWITSIATSVVCCSILFVVFAGYLTRVKEDIITNRVRIEMIEQRLNRIGEMDAMRHAAPPPTSPLGTPSPEFPR